MLLQESLVDCRKDRQPCDLRIPRRVIVEHHGAAQEHPHVPTDAKLLHRARERLVALAQKVGLDLRQSYARVGKFALIRHQRYAHAKQFKRANKAQNTQTLTLAAPSGQHHPADRPARRISRTSSGSLSTLQGGCSISGRTNGAVYSLHAP